MMFALRKLLYPLALLYELIIRLRHWLYDQGLLKSQKIKTPSICIGNINLGGSGKSPFISFLVDHYVKERKIAVLSRGYKRKTKGFQEVSLQNTASEVGDEPLQFKLQFPKISVFVDEKRAHGIQKIESKDDPELILLDDAFQHRAVQAKVNVLLSMYQQTFTDDLMLPAGNLRDTKTSARRSDFIIVTKTPTGVSDTEKNRLKKKLQNYGQQPVFFSKIVYAEQIIGRNEKRLLSDFNQFTLVTGIAQPQPLIDHLIGLNKNFRHLRYADHHSFSRKEVDVMISQQPILTTQKDFMRLKNFKDLKEVYYLPIRFQILDEEEQFFKKLEDKLQMD